MRWCGGSPGEECDTDSEGGKRTFAMRRRMSFLSGGSHHKFPGEECDANSEAARVILSNIKGISIQACM